MIRRGAKSASTPAATAEPPILDFEDVQVRVYTFNFQTRDLTIELWPEDVVVLDDTRWLFRFNSREGEALQIIKQSATLGHSYEERTGRRLAKPFTPSTASTGVSPSGATSLARTSPGSDDAR